MSWWNSGYFYRRKLKIIAPPEPVPAGHIVTCHLDEVLINNNKVRWDYEDIEVIYENEQGEIFQLYRIVDEVEDGLDVSFQVVQGLDKNQIIEDRYHIYYGNPDLLNITPRLQPLLPAETLFPGVNLYPADTINSWPVGVLATDTSGVGGYGFFTYTRPGEHWQDGFSSTRNARANLMIYATQFRIVSTVNRFQAMMEVQVDGGQWYLVDLFSEEEIEFKAVFELDGLDPDVIHEIRIRVTGRANTASQGDTINIQGIEYVKPVKAFDMGEEVNEEVWTSNVGGGQ